MRRSTEILAVRMAGCPMLERQSVR